MGEGEKWMERLSRWMSRSPEPLPGQPLVEIAGHSRVLIENHRGVCCYGREEIRIRVKYGQVAVTGCSLEIARMNREMLVITGRIDSVKLIRGVGA